MDVIVQQRVEHRTHLPLIVFLVTYGSRLPWLQHSYYILLEAKSVRGDQIGIIHTKTDIAILPLLVVLDGTFSTTVVTHQTDEIALSMRLGMQSPTFTSVEIHGWVPCV